MKCKLTMVWIGVCCVMASQAQSSSVWTGAVDGDWGKTDNWDGGEVPALGADITFPDADIQTLDLNGDRQTGTLTFNATDDYTLNNNTLTPGTNIVQLGSGQVILNTVVALSDDWVFTGSGIGTVRVGNAISATPATRRVTVDAPHYEVVLAGSNAYSGGTYLEKGTLRITGDNTASVSPYALNVTDTSASATLILESTSTTPLGKDGDWYVGSSGTLTLMSADGAPRTLDNRLSAFAVAGGRNDLTIAGPGNLDFTQGLSLNLHAGNFYFTVNNPTTTLAQVAGRTGTFHKYGPGTLVISGTNTLTHGNVSFRHYEGTVVFEGTYTNYMFSLQTDRVSSNKTFVFANDPTYAWGTSTIWYQGSGVTNAFRSADAHERSLAGVITTAGPSQTYPLAFQGPGNLRLINGLSARGWVTLHIENPRTIVEQSLAVNELAGTTLSKQGSGILEVAANCVATKFNTIAAGTLLVNGQITTNLAKTVMTVSSGATLGGGGRIDQSVSLLGGAILSPGDTGVGVLTVTNLTMNSDAIYVWEYEGGSGDRCDVTGSLTLPGGQAATLRLVAGDKGYVAPGDTFVLFNYAGADPVNPDWSFEYVGTRWGTSLPVVSVDTDTKRVVLSGISIPPKGSVIAVR